MTFFCESCGLRIVAAGKCKVCDPKGQDEHQEAPAVKPAALKTESAPADDKAAVAPRKG